MKINAVRRWCAGLDSDRKEKVRAQERNKSWVQRINLLKSQIFYNISLQEIRGQRKISDRWNIKFFIY